MKLQGYDTLKKLIPIHVSCVIRINDTPLSQVTSTKFLGILVDSNLSWILHTRNLSTKIASGVGVINRCKKLMPRSVLLNIYFALVYSHLFYCCILWGNASKTLLKPLQTLQNRALRHVFNLPYRTSASPLFKKLTLLKVYDLAHYQQALYLHQFKSSNTPQALNYFLNYCSVKNIQTRSRDIFTVPAARTLALQKNITVCGPKLWNALPTALQQIMSYTLFKRSLKQHITSTY
jgi:hypothetical protein